MTNVTITRMRDYGDVFSVLVRVPPSLDAGLRWIQAYCPLDEPTSLTTTELAEAWQVPEGVILLGLQTLSETGFFRFSRDAH